jgi:hypothetical protein
MEKEAGCETLVKGGIEATVAQASWEKALSEMQAQQNGGLLKLRLHHFSKLKKLLPW